MEQLGLNINFAVYEDWLLLNMGKEDLLVQLINRMNGDSIHLWEKKSVKYALNEIPSRVRQIDYVDFSEMFSIFEIMFNQIEKQEMGFEFQNGDFGQFPYFMLGWSKDIDGFRERWVFPMNEYGAFIFFLSCLAVFSSSNGLSADPALINLSKPEILLAGWNARCLEQGRPQSGWFN